LCALTGGKVANVEKAIVSTRNKAIKIALVLFLEICMFFILLSFVVAYLGLLL
jgi:hypothetical protein